MIGLRPYFILFAFIALPNCANVSPQTSEGPPSVPAPAHAPAWVASEPVEVPIPEASLLPLLQAEFALRLKDYDGGLALMADQAIILEDIGLARRALRLAEYVNDADRATAMAIRLSELDTQDGAAAAAAAGWLARTDHPVEALDYAALALERGHPVNVPATLGSYERVAPETQQAISIAIRQLLERWPEDDQVVIAASLLARLEKDFEHAQALLSSVLERSPQDTRAVMLWTQLEIDRSAADPFRRLADTLDAYPDNQELRLQYARLLGAEGDYESARQQFRILLDADPDNAELLGTAALLDFELQDFDLALEKFQRLIVLEARLNEANYYIGRIHMAGDLYNDAIAAFAAVGPSREFREAKALAAQLLADTAFASDIKAFFAAQRQAYPSAAEQLFLLEADALKDWEGETLGAYDRGLTAFPKSFTLLYGRAMLHESDGAYDQMESDLRNILSQDPDHAATLNALGYTLTNHTDRYQEAAALIERALALSPNDPAILDSLGWVYFKLGRYGQSEALLRRAHAAFPDPEVAAHLGEVLWVQGREVEAQDIWRQGLDKVPDHPIIREALDRLGAPSP